jgi:hypothetical protein
MFVLSLGSNPTIAATTAPGPEIQAAAVEQWESDLAALDARNQSESHPADSVLFVGSSSVRLWDTIATDMAPYHPIQRGFGGSRFSDLAVFASRLIAPHQFQALVLFAANDVTGTSQQPAIGSGQPLAHPARIVSGCGGQGSDPGMNRSTGTSPPAPLFTCGWPTNGPPAIAHAPTAITIFGSGTAA